MRWPDCSVGAHRWSRWYRMSKKRVAGKFEVHNGIVLLNVRWQKCLDCGCENIQWEEQ
jgi:hypothetical protein